jgi:hypothetical protein
MKYKKKPVIIEAYQTELVDKISDAAVKVKTSNSQGK